MSTRYVVHTRDPETDARERKVFEADSGPEARGMAEAIGLEVLALEVDAPTPKPAMAQSDDPLTSAAVHPDDPRLKPEQEDWQGSPSQWTNFVWFVLCIFIVTIPWVVWRVVKVATTDYAVTNQRLTLREGVFNRTLEEIELYRIKDTTLKLTLWQRILGRGTVVVESSDSSMPTLEIPWIKDATKVRELIRENVESVRRIRGVRELDVN